MTKQNEQTAANHFAKAAKHAGVARMLEVEAERHDANFHPLKAEQKREAAQIMWDAEMDEMFKGNALMGN